MKKMVQTPSAKVLSFLLCLSLVFLASCLGPRLGWGKLPGKEAFVDCRVASDGIDALPALTISNISQDTVIIERPNCFGINVWPVLVDNGGSQVPINFKPMTECPPAANLTLPPGSEHVETLPYSIQECFDIDQDVTYTVYVVYPGDVYHKNGRLAANDTPLKSNALTVAGGELQGEGTGRADETTDH